MFSRHRLAEVAALLGDAARAGIVLALWDGRTRPASELARIAGVTPATASSHLAKLVAGGILSVEPRGRYRFYRIADERVAHALESLAAVLPRHDSKVPTAEALPPLHRARMCYDHVAGRLGVQLCAAWLERGVLAHADGAFRLSPHGRIWFSRFGVPVAELKNGRRPLLRACLDWTERREHLGGALGAAFSDALLERDWIRRERGTRTLLVTHAGRSGLKRALGLRID